MMTNISYSGYRFPPEIIQQAIWLYVRFTLSFRNVQKPGANHVLDARGACERPRQALTYRAP
jgi:putative transposase